MEYAKTREPAKETYRVEFSIDEVKALLIKAAKEAHPDVDEFDEPEWRIHFNTDSTYTHRGIDSNEDRRNVVINRGVVREEK